MMCTAICFLLAAVVFFHTQCASSCIDANGSISLGTNVAPSRAVKSDTAPQRHLTDTTATHHSVIDGDNIACLLAESFTYGLKQAAAAFATRQRDPHLAHALRHLDVRPYIGDICPKTNQSRTGNATASVRSRHLRHLHANGHKHHNGSDAHANNTTSTNCTVPANHGGCSKSNSSAGDQQVASNVDDLAMMWREQEARIRTLEERIASNATMKKRKHHKKHAAKGRRGAPSIDDEANMLTQLVPPHNEGGKRMKRSTKQRKSISSGKK